ncbi:hypothetical protein H8S95_04510 [Pontibacter sp. KCTC 32443]|uniref:hypothetical protein n=1 Tax=Pontibacter TaxID=323449 RepID=UPI00164D88CB|nr:MULTISPECIES: hypothetical protein [Pontibacter]MBC5773317.1 hypothetical protein [Pontibacter sp. KCTC 32443]
MTLPAAPLIDPALADSRVSRIEYLILGIVAVHIALGIGSFHYNRSFFDRYIVEDGYIENITALTLLFISVILWIAAYRNNGVLRLALGFVALVFLFGSGEEISWGQRILNFQTPGELKDVNTQGEFNLHNIKLNDVKLNKLIFGTVMYTGIILYFVILPALYQFRSFFHTRSYMLLPLPKLEWGIMYLGIFLVLFFIPHGKLWELQEFTFSVFLLSSLFFQFNPKFYTLVSGGRANYTFAG